MSLSTHILDTARGRPAAGVPVTLDRQNSDGAWEPIGGGATDQDGRVKSLVPAGVELSRGVHRLRFATGAYFAAQKTRGFYPEVSVVFEISAPAEHHHVPLLLSPFGYATYRGS